LTPLESSFSSSDVGNKEKQEEEDLRRKVGETISLNIGALESSKNVKISTQCYDKEEIRFAKLLGGFQNVFGLMRIFVVLILVLHNMLLISRKA
jgi:hypothetical protein